MLIAGDYLPIGSIVLLEGGVKRLMVVGVMEAVNVGEEQKEEYDYIGVLYPEGFISASSLLLFNHNQIRKVVHRGYEDEERESFLKRIEQNMKIMEEKTKQ